MKIKRAKRKTAGKTYDPAEAAGRAMLADLKELIVSVKLVQAWEQGNGRPAIWARRLFDEMRRDPKHWRRMLKKASR